MKHIELGNYFESFPTIDSYILTIDYSELTDALNSLNGVPCTSENQYLRALTVDDWVKYWLQENKDYDVGDNLLGAEFREITTTPATPGSDTFNLQLFPNQILVDITSEIATSDDVLADMRWHVNFNTIVYNVATDDYTVQVYNSVGITQTLPYNIPSKPLQVHYVSFYYRNVDPNRGYIFIYQAGSGTYPDLDTIENPIDIDGTTLQAIPAIPLRISNQDYTTFGATKAAKIEELSELVMIDAEALIDRIMSDPSSNPGDIDNVYVNFGVQMWDTTQTGMSYLYRMFETLYPAQGVTQGAYNNTPAGDEKPANNIITETDDNKYVFQWSYITYEHTSLVDINANTGSPENGIYYSDMSRFDDNNILKYNYYVSSGKGTYNVGYKADDLSEVQDFLDGNGVPNPGTTTGEATNWLQVTERMSYNNPTPNLLEADNSASDLIYLTPDLVYENNGSGVLRLVESASEETTHGQSITYYCCKPSGLDAYTVSAPIAVCKVIDGDTGRFKMVKFNLGNKYDLMVPFIYTKIKDLSHREVTKLFLRGAHASIYIAHYEVIHHPGMSFWVALIMIIVIVVIVVVSWNTATGPVMAAIKHVIAHGIASAISQGLIQLALMKIVGSMVVNFVIQTIITELVDDEQLAAILSILAAVAVSGLDFTGGLTPENYATSTWSFDKFITGNVDNIFDNITSILQDPIRLTTILLQGLGVNQRSETRKIYNEIDKMNEELTKDLQTYDNLIKEYTDILYEMSNPIDVGVVIANQNVNPIHAEHVYLSQEHSYDINKLIYNQSQLYDLQINKAHYQYA